MKKAKKPKIIKIAAIIILLLIIGAIYIYPDIRFIIENGKDYKGIGLSGTPEELFYLARLNGVYKGSIDLSDIYSFEHQEDPWYRPFIGELIIGNIGRFFKISLVNLDILMSAILNMVLSILIFIFSYQLSRSVKLSIICSLAIILGYNVFSANIYILKSIISGGYAMPLWFLRPLSPQFYYIPFFIALIFIKLAMDHPDSKKDLLISGISLGALFYCNLYYWTFIYAGLAVLALFYLLNKRAKEALRIVYIYLISLITAIPYFLAASRIISHPGYELLQKNYMMVASHKAFFYAPYILPALVIITLFAFSKHKSKIFIISFLAGGILCLNQQVITGKSILQQWSFYSNKTFLIISIIISMQLIGKKIKPAGNAVFRNTVFGAGILFFISTAILQQHNYFKENKGLFLEKQKLAGACNWLKTNTSKSDVLLADHYKDFGNYLSNYQFLLTYTDNFNYIPETACMMLSEKEVVHRRLAALIFFGYDKEGLDNYIGLLKAAYGSANPYIRIYPLKEDYYQMLREEYARLKKLGPVKALRAYKIDYILAENTAASKLEKEYARQALVVYKDQNYTLLNLKNK